MIRGEVPYGGLVVPYTLRVLEAPDEATRKVTLMDYTSVNDRGVVVSDATANGGDRTSLVAVQFTPSEDADSSMAELVPLAETVVDGIKLFELSVPEGDPTHIGFFVGYDTDQAFEAKDAETNIIRSVTSRVRGLDRRIMSNARAMLALPGGLSLDIRELAYNLTEAGHGRSPKEETAAAQVGLFSELGFPEVRTRGVLETVTIYEPAALQEPPRRSPLGLGGGDFVRVSTYRTRARQQPALPDVISMQATFPIKIVGRG